LNNIHSIPATANNEYAVTMLDSRAVACSPNPCRHATRNEAGKIERNIFINHDDGCLIYHRAFGKSADHAKGANGNAGAITPAVCAVKLWSMSDSGTLSAEMM